MNLSLKDFEEKIDIQIRLFLKHIESFCREGFEYDSKGSINHSSGFPIFGLADSLFYQSQYQVNVLEKLVREDLVNELLHYLFQVYGYDFRQSKYIKFGGNCNKDVEKRFPAEFVIVEENGKTCTAFRYTPIISDFSIPYNLPNYWWKEYSDIGIDHIDKAITQWVSIKWIDTEDHHEYSNAHSTSVQDTDAFQITLTIEELFERYFSREEYNLFVQKIKSAVSDANSIIGFQTIPRLTSNNYSEFKRSILAEILNPDFVPSSYQFVEENGNSFSFSQNITINDTPTIYENFIQNSRYLSLIGTHDFAKSFLTAEYLFKAFKFRTAFDYTAVICGYIKSVEQLCSTIIYDYYAGQNDSHLFLMMSKQEKDTINELKSIDQIKTYNGKKYIRGTLENQQFFESKKNMTMGNLFYFFDVNKKIVFDERVLKSEPQIFKCMQNYFHFDRNGYLHKENIYDPVVADRIRKNTRLILIWLLGAIKLSENIDADNTLLCVVDDRFDRLYKKIAYRRAFRFLIKLADGTEQKVIRAKEGNQYAFDENGYICGAELSFYPVDKYPFSYMEYFTREKALSQDRTRLIINRDNMPVEIYSVDFDGTLSSNLLK